MGVDLLLCIPSVVVYIAFVSTLLLICLELVPRSVFAVFEPRKVPLKLMLSLIFITSASLSILLSGYSRGTEAQGGPNTNGTLSGDSASPTVDLGYALYRPTNFNVC